MGVAPKLARKGERINARLVPPSDFVTGPVQPGIGLKFQSGITGQNTGENRKSGPK
jgi:hypothetical protein